MKKTDWAYMAGFFDGEGSIGFMTMGRRRKTFRLRVQVISTNEWAVQFLRFSSGGSVGVDRHTLFQRMRWKTAYRWGVYDNKAYSFLKQIYPYLKLKKPQAELAFLFQEHKKRGGYKAKEYMDFEADFKQQITLLNHRGK